MNQNSNNIVNTYLKEIKRKAPAAYCTQLMDELESSVECYVEQNSVNRIEVLYQVFGTPDDYVNGFISSLDSPSISKSIQRQKRRNILLISIISFLLLILVVSFIWIMNENHRHTTTYFITESVYEEENILEK